MSRRPTDLLPVLVGLVLVWGCVSTRQVAELPPLEEGVARLSRPLPGTFSALYGMRVAKTGGLRVAVSAKNHRGRLVISKPLGGSAAMAVWDGSTARLLDLERGCEADPRGAARLIGLGILPLDQVPRILGGRLPLGTFEAVDRNEGWLKVRGEGWSCRIRLAAHPWRVVELVGPDGTSVTLSQHTASVPGHLRIQRPDGDWIELELTRLQWNSPVQLPPVPDLPPCDHLSGPSES